MKKNQGKKFFQDGVLDAQEIREAINGVSDTEVEHKNKKKKLMNWCCFYQFFI